MKKIENTKSLKPITFWEEWIEQKINEHGLFFLNLEYPGILSKPRKYELAAAINRIRSLQLFEHYQE